MVKNKTKKKPLRSPLRIYTQCLICWTWLISLSLQCEVEDVCVTECVNTDPGYYCMPCPPRYKGTQPYGLGLQAAHENKQARVSLFEYQCSPPPPFTLSYNHESLCVLSALAAGVRAVQSLQRQHAHLPQVCWLRVPGPGVWGVVQVCVRRRVRGRRLPVRRRLWSRWLAQQEVTLQAERDVSLPESERTEENFYLIGWQCSAWMGFH